MSEQVELDHLVIGQRKTPGIFNALLFCDDTIFKLEISLAQAIENLFELFLEFDCLFLLLFFLLLFFYFCFQQLKERESLQSQAIAFEIGRDLFNLEDFLGDQRHNDVIILQQDKVGQVI